MATTEKTKKLVTRGNGHRNRKAWEVKKAAAVGRTAARASRTPAQQLILLDERLGKGVGATKERKLLSEAK